MNAFQPGPWGDAGPDPLQKLEQYAPLVQSAVEQVTDASRQVEVLTAQIRNTRQLMRRQPWASNLLRMRLRKLQARKRAAERRLLKQQEGESSTRTYRALGQVGIVAGIGLVLALTVRALRK